MASTEAYLTRAAVALSVILVLVLGALAAVSVFGEGGSEADEGTEPPAEAVEGPTAYPGEQFTFDDSTQPLTIGCVPTVGNTDVYIVTIANGSDRAVDYLVSARLLLEDGAAVDAMAEIFDLQPAEAREVVLVPDEPVDDIAECTIAAVESERRVLLINS